VIDEVRRIADAVLYEGYLLWPYRRSATKNVKRWTFGGLFPPGHTASHADDRCALQAQVLVEADAAPQVEATVRFLQVVERRVTQDGAAVDEVVAGGERRLPWDEAVERELPLRAPAGIAIAGGAEEEPLGDGAAFVRSWRALRAAVDLSTEPVGERLFRVTVRVVNETPWAEAGREDALHSTLCSTHVVLRVESGSFVSATEADDCENDGVWPVLVGDGSTMLAAPIILSDYPQIAPESPGDLFDATEIDRLLILNVLSLTPEEQAEMRATDPRARAILERCAALGPDELLPLHGVFREVGS
jgi:hydrogenase maturation protease